MGLTSATRTKENLIEVDREVQQMKQACEDSEDVEMSLEVEAEESPPPPSNG
jgi:hypothetical protein